MLTPGRESSCREVVWIEGPGFAAWSCSACGWVFRVSGWPTARTLEEITQKFKMQLSEEFASHVCAEHPWVQAVAAGQAQPTVRKKTAQS
jgi:hypothetical protein